MSENTDEQEFKEFEARFNVMDEDKQTFVKHVMIILTAARSHKEGHIEDGTLVDIVNKSMQMLLGEILVSTGMRQIKMPPDLMRAVLARNILQYGEQLNKIGGELANLILLMMPEKEKADAQDQEV